MMNVYTYVQFNKMCYVQLYTPMHNGPYVQFNKNIQIIQSLFGWSVS